MSFFTLFYLTIHISFISNSYLLYNKNIARIGLLFTTSTANRLVDTTSISHLQSLMTGPLLPPSLLQAIISTAVIGTLLKQMSGFSCHCVIIPVVPCFPQCESPISIVAEKANVIWLPFTFLSNFVHAQPLDEITISSLLAIPGIVKVVLPQDYAVLFPLPGLLFPPPHPRALFTSFLHVFTQTERSFSVRTYLSTF